MNSILSNLGPRYSRRNSATPIILGFLLLIIAIAVLTYFLTRDDEDKNKPEKTPDLPTVSNVGVEKTLNPDSSVPESSTSETYEIGGGKTETYQIEYNTGEQFSDDEKKLLSKNVDLTVSWNNGTGFDNVTEMIIKRKIGGTAKKTITYIKSGSSDDIQNFFKSKKDGLSLKFDNIGDDGNAYSVVGKNTISISVKIPDPDNTTGTKTIEIFPGTAEADIPVDIGLGDLSSTLEITSSRSQMYYPVTSSFNINNLEISKDIYSIKPSLSLTRQGSPIPFSQMLKLKCDNSDTLNTVNNDFHFIIPDTSKPGKFKLQVAKETGDGKWVKVCDTTNQLALNDVSSGASIFELVTSDKESEYGSSYNKFMIKGNTTANDLFMHVKVANSIPKLYMGKVEDMNADEYESMDMLIGSSGDQCGSGPNKYKFYMWKKGTGYHVGNSGFYNDASIDGSNAARITIKQDPDNNDKVDMYWGSTQLDGEHYKLLPFSWVPNTLGVARPALKSRFFDQGVIKSEYRIWCHNGKEMKTLAEFNKHIDSRGVVCDRENAKYCLEELMESTMSTDFKVTANTEAGNACSKKYNCEPDIWF